MVQRARRWLDMRGYSHVEIGGLVYWTYADCLCVVSDILFCTDEHDDDCGPKVCLIHVDGDPYPGSGSTASPRELVAVDDAEAIAESRRRWNENRRLYRHEGPFVLDADMVGRYMHRLVEMHLEEEAEICREIGGLKGKERRMAAFTRRRIVRERVDAAYLASLVMRRLNGILEKNGKECEPK